MILPRDRAAPAARETHPGKRQTGPTLPGATEGAATGASEAVAASAPVGALAPRTQWLFDSLPYAYRLMATRQRFPHVLERIAAQWESPARLLSVFDELMIDRRGNRQGFPFETMIEIANLRDYYVHQVRPNLRLAGPLRPDNQPPGDRWR